jgi:hypothetical protein
MALSLEVTTEPPPDISERSTISLRTRALARWGADAGYEQAWAQQEADILRAAAEGRVLNPDNITK